MRKRHALVGALSLLVVTSCGKEAGRVPFAAEGVHETSVALKPGEVAFWTDIDIKYEGDATLVYKVDLIQNGAPVASVACDPLGQLHVKTSWVETNNGPSHSRFGNGKMACSTTVASGGATTVRATLAFGRKPQKLSLNRADLVIRQ
jgi:hypothetical protein